jgi:hypothetical protein
MFMINFLGTAATAGAVTAFWNGHWATGIVAALAALGLAWIAKASRAP